VQLLKGTKRRVENLSFSPDGALLAAGGPTGPVEVWDTARGARAHTLPCAFVTSHDAIRFHPDGTLFVGGHGLCRYDLAADTHNECFPQRDYLRFVEVAPDGTFLIGPRGYRLMRFVCGGAYECEWDVPIAPDFGGHSCCYGGLAIFPGGARFVVHELYEPPLVAPTVGGGFQPRPPQTSAVVIRDCATGAALQRVPCPVVFAMRPRLSPDGAQLALVGGRSLFALRTADLSAPPKKLTNAGKLHFTDVAFHPSGRYLAVTSNDATVRVLDATTWDEVRTFTWKLGKMRCVRFSPDGLRVAAGAEKGQVVIWDADL
jgi:WD40 repeat protein